MFSICSNEISFSEELTFMIKTERSEPFSAAFTRASSHFASRFSIGCVFGQDFSSSASVFSEKTS